MSDQVVSGETVRQTGYSATWSRSGWSYETWIAPSSSCQTSLAWVPFAISPIPPNERTWKRTYRGEPGDFSHRIAFTELGPVELEIVQPLTGESGLTEFLEEHGEGIQHIRFNVDDLQPVLDYLAGRGIEPLMSGTGLRPGTTWVHLDTADKVGFVIEVMNTLPGTDGRTPQKLAKP